MQISLHGVDDHAKNVHKFVTAKDNQMLLGTFMYL